MSNIQRLWAAIRESGNGRYAPALARQQLTVVAVETDSNGAVTTARGSIDGSGDFSVPVRGEGVRVGMLIGVTQPAHDPAAPLTFDGIDATDDPTAGYFDIDPDLPAPTFSSPNNATAIVKSPGSVTARITVLFDAVTEKYKPSSYLVTWRLTAGPGEWQDVTVPHLGGAQECNLGSQFAPGSQVDVKLRTRYDWAHAYSVASAAVTITAASDNASPGTATTVVVDNSVAGQLVCTVTASTVDADLFRQWRYEFSTSATGPFSDAIVTPGPATFVGTPGAWYVRVAPVSKSGTVGTYTSWTGPTTLTPAAPALDTTAPAAWSAPTVSLTRITPSTGGESATLTVTFPARTYEADYYQTIVRATNGSAYVELHVLYTGTAHAPLTVPGLGFGTWQVTLQAEDISGNRSAASSAGSDTLASSGVPGAMGNVVTASASEAVRVVWTLPANTQAVDVWRATTAGGAGAIVIDRIAGTFYIDTFIGAGVVGTTYYYKAQAVNLAGSGTISPTWVAGTVGAVDGSNLAVNSVTANKLEANLVIGTTIRTASGTTRLEMDGINNRFAALVAAVVRMTLDPTDLIFYDASGVYQVLVLNKDGLQVNRGGANLARMVLDGNGLEFLNDANVWVLRTGQAAGVGYLESAGGFTIRGDYTDLDLTAAQQMRWHFTQADTGGDHTQHLTLCRLHSSGTVSTAIGLIGYKQVGAGSQVAPRVVVGFSTNPAATNNMPTDYVQLEGGICYASNRLQSENGLLVATNTMNYTGGNWDFDAPIRSVNGGAAIKLKHLGTSDDAYIDWSHGPLWLGYNANPSNIVAVGNGAAGYGPILASAFTVSSDRTFKDDVRDLEPVGAAFDSLRVVRYTRTDDPAGRQRIGLVADEVARVAPEAVVVTPHLPASEDGTLPARDGGQAIDLYTLLSLTTAALRETRQQVATLTTRLAALEAR